MGGKNSKEKKNSKKRQSIETDVEIIAEQKKPIKLYKYKEIDEIGKMFFKLEEKTEKINYLTYIDFNDYMISLSKFTLKDADLPDNYKLIKYTYSCKDDFYNEQFNIEYLQSFIESKILKHEKVYQKAFHSENSQERALLFKDFLFYLYKGLMPKIKQIQLENGISEEEVNENTIMKKNSAIIYGLLFCAGDDWLKVRIFFNLFKENGKLKKSEDLDYFLFMLFTTATYAMCYSRSQLSKYKNIGELDQEDLGDVMKFFQVNTTKSLVEYTNKLLFGIEKNNELLYEQFRQRCEITEKKESASYIFSPRGIRYMYKELSGVVIEKKKLKKKKTLKK